MRGVAPKEVLANTHRGTLMDWLWQVDNLVAVFQTEPLFYVQPVRDDLLGLALEPGVSYVVSRRGL